MESLTNGCQDRPGFYPQFGVYANISWVLGLNIIPTSHCLKDLSSLYNERWLPIVKDIVLADVTI